MSQTRNEPVIVEHLRALVANVLHSRSGSTRVLESGAVSGSAADVRDALSAGLATTSGRRVMNMLEASRGDADAIGRELLRSRLLTEVRDLEHYSGLLPANVIVDGETGYGPAPLVREVARPWTGALLGGSPVVPGFVGEPGSWGEVDPALPVADGDAMTIGDVAAGDGRHLALVVADVALQLMDFLTSDGEALLDEIVLDEADLAAERFIAEELVDAAAGTRPAGADLGAALDDAEGAAGGRGPVELAVVAAADLPAVRRALASTFFEGPRPELLVSAGQPAGTATFVGRGGMLLLANDHQLVESVSVRNFARGVAVGRPFFLQVRDAEVIQTVTGIGA